MDIVHRLRITMADEAPFDRAGIHIANTCNEAADLIERLRGLLETIAEQLQGVDGGGPVSTTDEDGDIVSALDEDTWSALCAEVWP